MGPDTFNNHSKTSQSNAISHFIFINIMANNRLTSTLSIALNLAFKLIIQN